MNIFCTKSSVERPIFFIKRTPFGHGYIQEYGHHWVYLIIKIYIKGGGGGGGSFLG